MQKNKHITIFHGPQHPGITGNMSVELDLIGETIQKATTHVGYLHRGFEKLIERRSVIQAFTIVCRICVPEPDPNEINFALAVEELADIEVPKRATYIRMMVLELSRLAAQFLWIAGQSGSVGLYAVGQWAIADRDLILDLFEELTGARVYHMYIYPGGVRRDLPQGFLKKVSQLLTYFKTRLPEYDAIFLENASFKARAKNVGVIQKEEAIKNGYVGQVLRACGIAADVRKDAPYLDYKNIDFEVPTQTEGDVYARALVRKEEMNQSVKILEQIVAKMPEGAFNTKLPTHRKFKLKKDDTWVKVESARGEFAYYMAGDGSENIRRMQVRGPSLVHAYTLLEKLLVNEELSDVALIMNSLGICPPEIER